MEFFVGNIEEETIDNVYYRRVLFTTKEMQLVVMKLYPGEVIPQEIHPKTTQFIRVEKGKMLVRLGSEEEEEWLLEDDEVIVIPAGMVHTVYAVGNEPLSLYTIYAPPEHDSNRPQLNP
jgi:mannose-6-phosphate isomerase-like protein (cupin superfamily)